MVSTTREMGELLLAHFFERHYIVAGIENCPEFCKTTRILGFKFHTRVSASTRLLNCNSQLFESYLIDSEELVNEYLRW